MLNKKSSIFIDLKLLILSGLCLLLVFFTGNIGLIIVYGVFICLGIKDYKNIIPVLLLANFIMSTNSVVSVSLKPVVHFSLVFTCFTLTITQLCKRKCNVGRIGVIFAIMSGVFLITALVRAEYLVISILKLFSFVCLFFSLYCGLQKTSVRNTLKCLYNYWAVYLLLSFLILILAPSYGFLLNGRSFQGIASHPMTMGVILSICSFVFFSMYFFYRNMLDKWFWLLGASSMFFIYISYSRTAVFSFALAYIVLLFYAILFNREAKSRFASKVLIASLIISIIIGATFSDQVISFAFKEKRDFVKHKDLESMMSSRSRLMQTTWDNFISHPLLGIGFASPNESKDFEIKMLPGTDIPISAPTEKGNFFLASLETVGLIGTLILVLLLSQIFMCKWHYYYVGVASFFIVLLVNITECFLYGVNSNATLFWYCCLLGISESKVKL